MKTIKDFGWALQYNQLAFGTLIKNFSKGKMDNNRDKFKYSKSLFDSLIFTISSLNECEIVFFLSLQITLEIHI